MEIDELEFIALVARYAGAAFVSTLAAGLLVMAWSA
jgi:hypothetical protein